MMGAYNHNEVRGMNEPEPLIPIHEMDKVKDECGLFGIYAPGEEVAYLTYLALYGVQHRGQDSAGIAVFDGDTFRLYKGVGLAAEVFNKFSFAKFTGHAAIGHVYSANSKEDIAANAQPLAYHHLWGRLAIGNNGCLVNKEELCNKLAKKGAIFQTNTDSEVLAHLIASYALDNIEDALVKMQKDAKGSYSTVILTKDKLIGLRDPHGIRPLCLGKMNGHYVLSSESCAFHIIGAEFIREVEAGEIIIIDANGMKSIKVGNVCPKHCVFEHVYIARPDSFIDNIGVGQARRNMGHHLAKEFPIEADIVIPVPDSGAFCALGYAEESGIPYTIGMLKNRYIGRTFLQPSQKMRDLSVQLKLSPIKEELQGKRVIMVDDSIVRGTTSRQIVQMLRDAGATEVHMVVSSPPVLFGCYYGVDTKKDQLIAVKNSVEQTRKFIGVDSLYYLSMEGMLDSLGKSPENFCVACFNGKYTVPVPEEK